jgi:Ctr copper transporter family
MGLLLMLVFMTFNVYLCLAVTVGGAVGYYCFAWATSPGVNLNDNSDGGKHGKIENSYETGYCH